MSFKKSFHPYAMTTIFFWSLAYVNTRLALKYFSPFAIGFLRYAVAALAMLIVVLVQKIKPPKAKDMIWFALSGATGFFTFATMLNLGSRTVNSSTSSVIVATTPIMTAILARIFYKEKGKFEFLNPAGEEYKWALGDIDDNSALVYLYEPILTLEIYQQIVLYCKKISPELDFISFSPECFVEPNEECNRIMNWIAEVDVWYGIC